MAFYDAVPLSDRGYPFASAAPPAGRAANPVPVALQLSRSADSEEPSDFSPEESKRMGTQKRVSMAGPLHRSKSAERRSEAPLFVSTSGRLPHASKAHHFSLPGYAYSRRHRNGQWGECLSSLVLCLGFLATALLFLSLDRHFLTLPWTQWVSIGRTADCTERAKDQTAPQGASQRGSEPRAASRFLVEPYSIKGPVPWAHLSPETRRDFTLGYQVPVRHFFKNSTGDLQDLSHLWRAPAIDALVARAAARNASSLLCSYGVACNEAVFGALAAHPIVGQNVLVVGSQKPWLEALCLSFGAETTITVDFNKPSTDHPRMRTLSVPELDASDETFDAIFSYSSLEHDGLGRYGDPLNPFGDLQRMKKLMGLLKPQGKLYLGVPMGLDFMIYNAHRVYGALRFPLLIEGWVYHGTYGDNRLEQIYAGNFSHEPQGCFWKGGCYVQPVHVLGLGS